MEKNEKRVRQSPWWMGVRSKDTQAYRISEAGKNGEIDLRYLDQSGFSLTPYIPYGWQKKKEKIMLKSSQGKRINVRGLMNRKNELY